MDRGLKPINNGKSKRIPREYHGIAKRYYTNPRDFKDMVYRLTGPPALGIHDDDTADLSAPDSSLHISSSKSTMLNEAPYPVLYRSYQPFSMTSSTATTNISNPPPSMMQMNNTSSAEQFFNHQPFINISTRQYLNPQPPSEYFNTPFSISMTNISTTQFFNHQPPMTETSTTQFYNTQPQLPMTHTSTTQFDNPQPSFQMTNTMNTSEAQMCPPSPLIPVNNILNNSAPQLFNTQPPSPLNPQPSPMIPVNNIILTNSAPQLFNTHPSSLPSTPPPSPMIPVNNILTNSAPELFNTQPSSLPSTPPQSPLPGSSQVYESTESSLGSFLRDFQDWILDEHASHQELLSMLPSLNPSNQQEENELYESPIDWASMLEELKSPPPLMEENSTILSSPTTGLASNLLD